MSDNSSTSNHKSGAEVEGSIEVLTDRTIVKDLTITNLDTVQVLQQAPPMERLLDIIDIGTRGWTALAGSSGIAHVEDQLDRLARGTQRITDEWQQALAENQRQLENELARLFQEDENSPVRKTLTGFARHLAEKLDVNRSDGAIAEIVDTLAGATRELGREQVRNVMSAVSHQLDMTQPDSPMAKVDGKLNEISGALREVVRAVAGQQARNEEASRGTSKGRTFEDIVVAMLSSAVPTGAVEDTSTSEGIDGNKVGDCVWSWKDPRVGTLRLVAEAKTEKRKSLAAIRREAAAAISNRGAGGCLWLVDSAEKVPNGAGPLMVLDDDRIAVVSLDPEDPHSTTALKLALTFIQVHVLEDALRGLDPEEEELLPTLDEVRGLASSALERLKRFSTIRRDLSQIRNCADRSRETLREVDDEVAIALTEVTAAVDRARGQTAQ